MRTRAYSDTYNCTNVTNMHTKVELRNEADKVSEIQTTLEESISKIKQEEDALAAEVIMCRNASEPKSKSLQNHYHRAMM